MGRKLYNVVRRCKLYRYLLHCCAAGRWWETLVVTSLKDYHRNTNLAHEISIEGHLTMATRRATTAREARWRQIL